VTGECGGHHALATHGASSADAVKQVVYVTDVHHYALAANSASLLRA
jgi:hypothetical protein